MPGAWEQQAAAAAAAGQQAWGAAWDAQGAAHARGLPAGQAAGHMPLHLQQHPQHHQQPAYGGAVYAQPEDAQPGGQQAQWDPRYEPYAAMENTVRS